MNIKESLILCDENYRKWKDLALKFNKEKFIKRAFFWIELKYSFLLLWALERFRNEKEVKERILSAKLNLCKKLLDYAEEILKEYKS